MGVIFKNDVPYGGEVTTILDTMEEIESNTEENKIAGALAVKEVIEHSKLKLLWENPTPANLFSTQTITLASAITIILKYILQF